MFKGRFIIQYVGVRIIINYDVAIIGGGIGGIMTAYRLLDKNPALKVIMFEKGHALNDRKCPILLNISTSCVKCKHCAIMEGMAGAGAFSDGKYVITTEYGGWLTDFLNEKTVMEYIEIADEIMVAHGAITERFQPDNELKKLCLQNGLYMQQAQVKHLGTDANFKTMMNIISKLSQKVEIRTLTEVTGVDKNCKTVTFNCKGNTDKIVADKIIFAVGRVGSLFLQQWCQENNIGLTNNQVDIGVRVELPALIWEDFAKKIYEPKIWHLSEQYGDITRMFCFNDRGNVVTENTGGVITVNGHSYRDEERKTKNSNFALLSTQKFTTPFKEPIEYARHIAYLANLISGDGILVQRFGDLIHGRRTTEERLKSSTTVPTLDAVAGDLSLCMPKRQLDNIIETIYALDRIAPGTANHDTLLYGIECKYYSARPVANDFEIDGCDGIYAIGDGAGFTRSLAQAAANGIFVADKILKIK